MNHIDPATPRSPTESDVRGVLAGVLDPELNVSIVDLGMLKGIDIGPDGDVQVKVALTTAACPLRTQIATDVKSKVSGLPGVSSVGVEYGEMTQAERSDLMARARRAAQDRAPATEIAPTTRVIAVGSGLRWTTAPKLRSDARSACSAWRRSCMSKTAATHFVISPS